MATSLSPHFLLTSGIDNGNLFDFQHPTIIPHYQRLTSLTDKRIREVLMGLASTFSFEPLKKAIKQTNWKSKSPSGEIIFFTSAELESLNHSIAIIKQNGAVLGFNPQEISLAVARSSVSEIFISTVVQHQLEQYEKAERALNDLSTVTALSDESSFELDVLRAKIRLFKDFDTQSRCYFAANNISILMAKIGVLIHLYGVRAEFEKTTEALIENWLVLEENKTINMSSYGSFPYAIELLAAKFEGKILSEADQTMYCFFRDMIHGLKLNQQI